MFKDIALFLLVFAVFLFGFAFAFFILQVRRQYIVCTIMQIRVLIYICMQLEGFRSYFGAIMSVYQISLGAWEWDNIYEGGPIAIMFFVAYTIIGTIMLLNLLIAVRKTHSTISSMMYLYCVLIVKLVVSTLIWLDDGQHVRQDLGRPAPLL